MVAFLGEADMHEQLFGHLIAVSVTHIVLEKVFQCACELFVISGQRQVQAHSCH